MEVDIYYHLLFQKNLKKLHPSQKDLIIKKIKLFKTNPFHPQLKSHKLKGKLRGNWSFSISYNLRILFEFIDGRTIGFIDIGTHNIYK